MAANCPVPIVNLSPIWATYQSQSISFDFGNFLAAGVVLTGTPTINVLIQSGTDPNPQSHLYGPAVIGTVPLPKGTGITNTAVIQQFVDGIAGVVYLLECICSSSDNNVAVGVARLPCIGVP